MSKYGKGLSNATSIQGLEAFFRADNVTTDGVSPWRDLSESVNVHDFTQSVSANKPSYTEHNSAFLEQGTLSFDGTNDYLTTPDHAEFELTGGLTVYIVGKFTAVSGATLASKASTAATTMSWSMEQSATGTLSSRIRNAANTAYYSVDDVAVTMDGTAHIFKFRFDAATLSLEAKTDTNAAVTLVVADFLGTSASSVNIASRLSTGGSFATGDYARVLVYDNAVSTLNDTAILSELNAVYRGVGSSTDFDFASVAGLVLDLDGDRSVQYDILTCSDLTGNGYDLTWGTGKFSSRVSSKLATRVIYSQGGAGARLVATMPIDAPPGKKLSLYAVVALESPKSDPTNQAHSVLRSEAGTTGWLYRVIKQPLGDSMQTLNISGGTPLAITTLPNQAAWAPGTAQVLRWEIDGDAAHHELYSGDGSSLRDWTTTVHTMSTGVFIIGSPGTDVFAGEIAAVAFFVNDGITDAQHKEIVDELTNEFLLPFDPTTQIPTLAAYWRADSGTTSTGIALWRDSSESSNIHNASQATDASRPLAVLADPSFASHNSISFDGTNDYFTVPNHTDIQLGGGLTIYTVCTVTSAGVDQVLFSKHNAGVTNAYTVLIDPAGKIVVVIRNAANTVNYVITSTSSITDGLPHVVELHYDGATASLFIDSIANGTVAAPDFREVNHNLGLGAYATGTANLTGKIARVLAYSSGLAAGDRTNVNTELMGLYGISGSSTGFEFSSVSGLAMDLDGDKGVSPAALSLFEPMSGKVLTDTGNNEWYYNATSDHFKVPTIESFGSGSMATAIDNYLEPDTGGRLITYVAGRFSIPDSDASGKSRTIFQQFVGASGHASQAQYIAGGGVRPVSLQYDSLGALQSDTGDYDFISGVPSISRFQLDDTGAEILGVVDEGVHTPTAATGYTHTTAGGVLQLGDTVVGNTIVGEIAAVLVFKVEDRISWGAHKAITNWMRSEFFSDITLPTLSNSVLHLAGNVLADTDGVNTWTDNHVGTPHNAVQTIAANKPAQIMQDPDFNLSRSLWFDGINDSLLISDHAELRAGTGFTCYIVANISTSPPSSRTLISKGSSGWRLDVESTGTLTAHLRNAADTAWVTAVNTTNVCDGVTRVLRIMWDGSTLYCRGETEGSTAAPDAYAADLGDLGIGDLASGGQPLACRVGAVYQASRSVTTYEDARLTEILDAAYVSTYNSFTPRQITSCVLDLDGDAGIELATGVATWKDISPGTAHHFVQAIAADQPAYTVRDSTFYRHGAVQGDGTSDELSTAAHTDLDPGTGFEQWWVVEFPTASAQRTLMIRDGCFILQANASGSVTASLRNAANTAYVSVTTVGTYGDGVPRIVRMWWDGATLHLTVGTETVSIAAPDARAASAAFLLAQPGIDHSDAKAARILHFNAPLSTTDVDQVNTYLSDKYRVTKAAI